MAGGKETPRQRMINIMYLVLLAMLALNVSDTILDAFKNLNDSLSTSLGNVKRSTEELFKTFENTKLKENPERAKPIYAKAVQARAITSKLYTYIDSLKNQLIIAGKGYNKENGDLIERSNLDISPGIMVNGKAGIRLKNKINQTRRQLINLIDAQERESTLIALEEAKDEPKKHGGKTWEEVNFGEGTPLTAAMTILTKLQADVSNTESDILEQILGKMDKSVITLDKFAAVAVAPTSYVLRGQPYTAEVFLTAYDSKMNPSISINGAAIPVKEGRGLYTLKTSKEGIYTWRGTIHVKQNDGSYKDYQTPEQKYQVAEPSAVVSPDKMNVFYVGVPNPVSISSPGISAEKLKVSIDHGSLSGKNGKYNILVTSLGTATVSVSAELSPGKIQVIGNTLFRCKRIPDPKAKFAGKTGGALNAVILKSQNNVFASLENFDFDAKFTVTRFTLILAKPGADAVVLSTTGNALSPAMRSAMASITGGTRVIFDNIVAIGPDGINRTIDPIVLTAN